MGKQKISYDPDFKTRGKKSIVHARTTQCYVKKNMPKYNKKTWNIQERRKYLNFIKENKELLQNCRKNQTFVLMSKMIKSRDPDQCKTHHVKMMKKSAGYVESLIQNLSKKLKKLQEKQLETVCLGKIMTEDDFKLDSPTTIIQNEMQQVQKIQIKQITPIISSYGKRLPVIVLKSHIKTVHQGGQTKK